MELMNDKEKQIEELNDIISEEYNNGNDVWSGIAETIYEQGYRQCKDKVVLDNVRLEYKDKKIYLGNKHIGYIEFSVYNDIKALGFGNFEIIDKRKGYGTLVIQDIIHKYKDKYNLIYCFVSKDNIDAIEFYKKVGKVCFDTINNKGQYQVILYGKEDKVVLTKEEYESVQKLYTYDKPMLDRIDCFIKEIQNQARNEMACAIVRAVFDEIDWSKDTKPFETYILNLANEYSMLETIEEEIRKDTVEKFMVLRSYITRKFHKYHEARDKAESEYKKGKEEMGKTVLNNDWHRCDAIMFILEDVATQFEELVKQFGVEVE